MRFYSRALALRMSLGLILLLLTCSQLLAVTDRPLRVLNDVQMARTDSKEFSFIVFGDFRASRRDRPYHEAFLKIMSEIEMINPDFAVSTGDAYYGYGGSFQRFKNEIEYFEAISRRLSIPFFNVIGNHELGGGGKREDYIRERFGNLYGSFDFGNSHFIVLNTEEKGREGMIMGEQLEWLKKDLENNKNSTNIFVFMHRPMYSIIDPDLLFGKSFRDRENRDYLHSLFKKFRVKAVFAGHEHLFSETIKDGIRYIVTGGGGSPLYQSPKGGGYFHYLIANVKGEDINLGLMVPGTISIRTITGNDGFEEKTEVEVSNISYSDLKLKNIPVMMPMAGIERYKVKAIAISVRGERKDHSVRIARIRDNRDGTALLGIEAAIPANGLLRINVEVDI
ncbi:MAG: metallophosphoesterase family protein [Thermodesulfovibrionales bacterium]